MEAADAGIVVTLNENHEDAHAIIQSSQNNRYLHCYPEDPILPDALRFTENYSFWLDTKYEVVPATTGTGFVHIRSLQNNKYWEKFAGINNLVSAMAAKPEENQSDEFCTLFQPIFVFQDSNSKHVLLKLRDVSSGNYVKFFGGSGDYYGFLSLMAGDNDYDVCTFISWESLVMLPDRMRINCDNGNHLKAYEGGLWTSVSKPVIPHCLTTRCLPVAKEAYA